MDQPSCELIWNDVITLAKSKYNDEKMSAWLSKIMPISYEDQAFKAAMQLAWPAAMIMREYKELIESCIEEITLEPCSFTVEVKPELFIQGNDNLYEKNSVSAYIAQQNNHQERLSVSARKADAYHVQYQQPCNPNQSTQAVTQFPANYQSTNAQYFPQAAQTTSVSTPSKPVNTATKQETNNLIKEFEVRNKIDSKKTFDTFFVADSNSMAQAAAKRVAEDPGQVFNPFFLFSKSGLGKTHLLMAIYNYIKEYYPEKRVIYVTAEQFLQDYIREITESRKSQSGQPIMMRYRDVDVLLVDDIQFLESKDESQEFFFATFNELTEKGSQVVISADRSPKELKMDERMTSRFVSGLSQNIQPPTFELKLAIVKNFYQRRSAEESWYNAEITDEQLTHIASISSNNIREIEGFMTKVMVRCATNAMRNKPLTTQDIDDEALEIFDINRKKIEISTISRVVEKHYNVTHDDLVGPSRKKNINHARQIAWYLSRELTDESLQAIGNKFGKRNHATVMNGLANVTAQIKSDRLFYDELERLKETIRDKS